MEVKTIGSSGQISLGKQHAGRTVTVEELEHGVWLVKTAQVVPDSEMWLHQPAAAEVLDLALDWAETHAAAPSDLDKLAHKIPRKR